MKKRFLKSQKENYCFIQKFQFKICIQKDWKQISERHLYIHVHSSIFHNSQKVGSTQMSIDIWYTNVVCMYYAMLVSF
jgi:hypothetical protein